MRRVGAITVEAPVARPFVKWAGGKASLLPEILSRLPKTIKTYYEPFVGGGAVFFALAAENRFQRATLNDINEELRDTYAALRQNVGGVIACLEKHAKQHGKTYFYGVRAHAVRNLESRAARLIYLNRTCFNGLYRVNKKGGFNVPFGDYANPTICDELNLRAVSTVLQGVDLLSSDFEKSTVNAKRGDAVYFDPPYAPLSETANFTAYSKGGFGADEHERLRNLAEKLIGRGVHVLLSNSDTPFVRNLYRGFKLEKVQARRNINSKGDKRGKINELLISGRA
jgi:DNA adenine methylase